MYPSLGTPGLGEQNRCFKLALHIKLGYCNFYVKEHFLLFIDDFVSKNTCCCPMTKLLLR